MKRALLGLGLLLLAGPLAAAPVVPSYPPAERSDNVEARAGGARVADPYRWLEGDVRTDPKVQAWVAAEVKTTQAYLAGLPRRDQIRQRLTELYNFERVGLPIEAGGRLFYRRNTGLQNQSTLDVSGLDGAGARTLIDPNGWSKDGATALAEWRPSRDGRYLAYTVQDGGTDWRWIEVIDTATGQKLPDRLDWAKFTELAWDRDGKGFFYSRYPAGPKGRDYVSAVFDHMIYYHRLGEEQSKDRLVFRTPEHAGWYNDAETTADGRWLVIRSSRGSDDRYEIHVVDLASRDWTPHALVTGLEHDYQLAGGRGGTLYFVTNNGAERYRVVAVDAAAPGPATFTTVVPEGKDRIDAAVRVGDMLLVESLQDARSALTAYPLAGGAGRPVALPGLGSAALSEESETGRTFWSFTSFATPATLYSYDARTGAAAEFKRPKVAFNPDDYETREVLYPSKDGMRVPLFITRRKGATGPAPTLLYAYGGFNISVPPTFSPATVAWLEMGGAYAQANIRGGGEYGTRWHEDGKLFKKQNVFDDFIAAGEYLIDNGHTPRDGLAIRGGSNGGLLIGAVVNQRPDLFAAALPQVGVMDMTRFHLFTEGRTWTDDYGDPNDPKALAYLLTYSPYHNIRSGVAYPAVLATTADTDDRVVPAHSFKYIAALQAANVGDKPHLIRIETRAGHGSGKPVSKQIEETADLWTFAGYWTGLTR